MFVSIHDTLLKLRDTALCVEKMNQSLVDLLVPLGQRQQQQFFSLISITNGNENLYIYMYISTELWSLDKSRYLNSHGIVVKLSISLF